MIPTFNLAISVGIKAAKFLTHINLSACNISAEGASILASLLKASI
jgi:hypothetical protein